VSTGQPAQTQQNNPGHVEILHPRHVQISEINLNTSSEGKNQALYKNPLNFNLKIPSQNGKNASLKFTKFSHQNSLKNTKHKANPPKKSNIKNPFFPSFRIKLILKCRF
jgi:hypothetical protein